MSKLLNCKEYLEIVEIAVKHVTKNMILNKQEEENIRKELKREICLANRIGEMDQIAKEYGLEDYLTKIEIPRKNRNRLLVMGYSQLKKKDMYKNFKGKDISHKMVDFVDYDMKRVNVNIINGKYQFVFAGPVPHKVKGMGNENSAISFFENSNEVSCQRLGTNCLKITKNTLDQCLQNLNWN